MLFSIITEDVAIKTWENTTNQYKTLNKHSNMTPQIRLHILILVSFIEKWKNSNKPSNILLNKFKLIQKIY